MKKKNILGVHNRKKLGLIFSHNEQWIGGTYYILNLIAALKTLPVDKQPSIIILSKNTNDFLLAKQTGYPFLQYKNPYLFKRNIIEKIIDKSFKLTISKYFFDKRISPKNIDALFPATNEYCYQRITNKIFWFADFQHIILPAFFDADEIQNRNNVLQFIAASNNNLVLSSVEAKKNWDALPFKKYCTVNVIPFAVTHPPLIFLDINKILQEYNLQKKYFIICNQFWAHKNHFLVLKAIAEFIKENTEVQFIFTGKQDDYRNPNYFQSIKDFITNNALENFVQLLGLIDRQKQLLLMKHSVAVIQPSLFEGWSTVVEDAKLLGCNLIVSDIAVHKEQLQNYTALYFDTKDVDKLVQHIKYSVSNSLQKNIVTYSNNVVQFGKSFFDLIQNVSR